MKNSHLFKTLSTFHRSECRALVKWINSPAHNTRQDVIDLINLLLEGIQSNNEMGYEKDELYKAIFPNEDYDDAKFRQTIHFSQKIVQQFLIYNELENDPVNTGIILSRVYRKRNLNRSFTKQINSITKKHDQQALRNIQYLQNDYSIQQLLYSHLSRQTGKKLSNVNLQEASDSLDKLFIAEKLKQSTLAMAHQTVYSTAYEIGLLHEIIKYIDNNPTLLENPAIAVYYYTYMAAKDKDNEHYFKCLKEEMFNNAHRFLKDEIRDLYLIAINYCIGKLNSGKTEYWNEAFELYREGFDQKILQEANENFMFTFQNAINIALRLKKFQWTQEFIEHSQEFLDPNQRFSIVHSNLARVYFEMGAFEKAQDHVNMTEKEFFVLNLNNRVFQAKLFYMRREFQLLESYLESMRIYLSRQKMIGYHKTNYRNIINLIRKLLKVNPYIQQDVQKLRQEILDVKPLNERPWLLEQVDNL